MSKYSGALLIILTTVAIAAGQEYWFWQNPLPQGNALNDLWAFSSKTVIAVGGVGTIIRTTDGGVNWDVTHNVAGVAGDLNAVYFVDQNVGWAAGTEGKVLKTTNGGISWNLIATLANVDVRGLFFHDSQKGWAAGISGGQGVLLSTVDGGINWTVIVDARAAALNWIGFISPTMGWAVGSSSNSSDDIILRTQDGGQNWASCSSGATSELFCAYFVDNSNGWAVGKGQSSSGVIMKTDDGGITWSQQSHPLSNKFLWAVAFRDQNLGWVVGEGGSMLKTVNGGTTWSEVTNQARRNLKAVAFSDENFVMAVGNAGIILKSLDNGTVWQEVSTGTTTWHFYGIDFTGPDTGWIVGPNKTILKSINGGQTWTPQASSAPQNLLDVFMINNQLGWTVGEWGVILKTTTGGINEDWVEQPSGTNKFLHSCFFLNDQEGWVCGGPVSADTSIILHTVDGGDHWQQQNCSANASLRGIFFVDQQHGWVVGENGNVAHTTDGGNTWIPVNTGRNDDFYSLYFLSDEVGWIGGQSILFTSDAGKTWQEQIAFSSIDQVRALRFITPLIGWAALQGSAGALYKTMDGGVNWFKLNIGTENNLYDIDVVNDQMAWAVGTYSTILKTSNVVVPVQLTNFTANWVDGRIELHWNTASELNNFGFEIQRQFADQNNWQKIGFRKGHGTSSEIHSYSFIDYPQGSGKYRYRLKQIDTNGKFSYSSVREVLVPAKFALYQNIPNPFNPETEISYELPFDQQVTLEIYNMLGQCVARLIDGRQSSGHHRLIWDGRDDNGRFVGSGIYFYRIKTDNFEATRKLILLR